MLAPIHPDETRRMAALEEYAILDTEAEESYDDIVRLASQICGTPISLVSLVGAERQWFKAELGMGARQTDLQRSICSHVILQNELLEIPNTTLDARTRDNPLVTQEPHLRFYAGAPLVTEEGLPLGTLCVLSDQAQSLSAFQKEALTVLARQVMTQMELRKTLKNQEVLQHEMDHRVKNSLQTVLSVVRLFGRDLKDEEAKAAFKAVERRLLAISELHAALHRSSVVERVDLAEFMSRVVASIQKNLPDNVHVTADLGRTTTTSTVATALAVVASEFTANSIKHAFSGDMAGHIHLRVSVGDDGSIDLECTDDGGASQVLKTLDATESLGKKIMEATAAQAGGEVLYGPAEQGYRLQMRLPPPAN